MRDVSGKVSGVIGVAHDITEQKRAEEYLRKSNEQLKESEERYRRLIELSSDTVIIQSEGKVVFINPAGLKLLGATHALFALLLFFKELAFARDKIGRASCRERV